MNSVVINFGSINVDHVYQVPHFVKPGETLSSLELSTGLGGKGANQSVALARAGVSVAHVGRISTSDQWAVDFLVGAGINVEHIELIEGASGHAIIQVDAQGENAIVLHGGANQSFELPTLESILHENQHAEYLLMQNECNLLAEAFELAIAKGLNVVLNPAPMTADIKNLPLAKLHTLIVNQSEAQMLSGATDIDQIIKQLMALAPHSRVVLTLGGDGAVLMVDGDVTRANAPAVNVVDTTGAGDTFVGYFLAGMVDGLSENESLHRACQAASMAASRPGAIASIPNLSELL